MRRLMKCRQGMAALLLTGFFVHVDMRVRADGSGKLFVTYPANPLMTTESEAQRFGSPVSTLTAFSVRHKTATACVRFSDLNGLSAAPELANASIGYQSDERGGGLFWATLRGAMIFDSPSRGDATVRVRLPGPVSEANSAVVADNVVDWRAPIPQFFSWTGIPMVARFTAVPKRLARVER